MKNSYVNMIDSNWAIEVPGRRKSGGGGGGWLPKDLRDGSWIREVDGFGVDNVLWYQYSFSSNLDEHGYSFYY